MFHSKIISMENTIDDWVIYDYNDNWILDDNIETQLPYYDLIENTNDKMAGPNTYILSHGKHLLLNGKHLLLRGAYYPLLASISLIACALDIIIGLGAAIATVCTLGKREDTRVCTAYSLQTTDDLLSLPYRCVVKTLYPKAKFKADVEEFPSFIKNIPLIQTVFLTKETGFFSKGAISSITLFAFEQSCSKNWINAHLISRLSYAFLAIASIATRTIDQIIGIFAVSLSILTLGRYEGLNDLASRTCCLSSLIADLSFCTVKIINPTIRLLRHFD